MGAGRERLVRQLATESVALAVAGGTLGIGLAALVVPLLARLVPMTLPMPDLPGVDLRVLSFAAVATALTGITFGLAPMLGSGRRPALDGLREGVRSAAGRSACVRRWSWRRSWRRSSCSSRAGCCPRARAHPVNRSRIPTEGVLTLRTELPVPRYLQTASRTSFYDRVLSGASAAGRAVGRASARR